MTLLQQVAPECKVFAETCESLLKRRQAGPVHLFKQWTRDELCDLSYSSYKALLRGVVRNPPRRNQVLDLADYFECNLTERNQLLVSAGYAPLNLYLTGSELQDALKVGFETLHLMPWPSIVITRDWTIHGVNAAVLQLFQLDQQQFERLPLEKRHVLHLTFDPNLPLYPLFCGGTAIWKEAARRDVLTFLRENPFALQEEWFQLCVQQLMQLPVFPELWKHASEDHAEVPLSPLHLLHLQMASGETLQLRLTYTLLGELDYPRILSYIPVSRDT